MKPGWKPGIAAGAGSPVARGLPLASMPKKRKPRRGKAGLSRDGCGEISGGDVNRRVEGNVTRACFKRISSEDFLVSSFMAETRPAFRHLWQQSGRTPRSLGLFVICSCRRWCRVLGQQHPAFHARSPDMSSPTCSRGSCRAPKIRASSAGCPPRGRRSAKTRRRPGGERLSAWETAPRATPR